MLNEEICKKCPRFLGGNQIKTKGDFNDLDSRHIVIDSKGNISLADKELQKEIKKYDIWYCANWHNFMINALNEKCKIPDDCLFKLEHIVATGEDF